MSLPDTLLHWLMKQAVVHPGASWEFDQGMAFRDDSCWWGLRRPRQTTHEGLDFIGFRAEDGSIGQLEAGCAVPVLLGGELVALWPDYLGTSIWVRTGRGIIGNSALFLGYCHLEPVACCRVGRELAAGEVIGRVADSGKSPVPPHFHLSVLQGPELLEPEELKWSRIHECKEIVFVDPANVMVPDPRVAGDRVLV